MLVSGLVESRVKSKPVRAVDPMGLTPTSPMMLVVFMEMPAQLRTA